MLNNKIYEHRDRHPKQLGDEWIIEDLEPEGGNDTNETKTEVADDIKPDVTKFHAASNDNKRCRCTLLSERKKRHRMLDRDANSESDVASDSDWTRRRKCGKRTRNFCKLVKYESDDYGARMLLRDWLIQQADLNSIPGLRWLDKDKRFMQIKWVHGSKSSWTLEDSRLFESWARHTGKFTSECANPKKWKANFRCALNSLPDVREEPSKHCKYGTSTYKVYKFLEEKPRKIISKRFRRTYSLDCKETQRETNKGKSAVENKMAATNNHRTTTASMVAEQRCRTNGGLFSNNFSDSFFVKDEDKQTAVLDIIDCNNSNGRNYDVTQIHPMTINKPRMRILPSFVECLMVDDVLNSTSEANDCEEDMSRAEQASELRRHRNARKSWKSESAAAASSPSSSSSSSTASATMASTETSTPPSYPNEAAITVDNLNQTNIFDVLDQAYYQVTADTDLALDMDLSQAVQLYFDEIQESGDSFLDELALV